MVVVPVIRFCSLVQPLLYLRMAVRKIKSAGAVVITRWKVNNLPGTRSERIRTFHFSYKIAVVDAVIPFVQKHKSFGRRRRGHISDFLDNLVTGGPGGDSAGLWIVVTDPVVHRHRAHMRITLASQGAHALVGRTVPDSQRLMVRPKMTFHQINGVGVVWVVRPGTPQIVSLVQRQPSADPR